MGTYKVNYDQGDFVTAKASTDLYEGWAVALTSSDGDYPTVKSVWTNDIIFGICEKKVRAGELVSIRRKGVVTLPKTSGAITAGTKIGWEGANGLAKPIATKTPRVNLSYTGAGQGWKVTGTGRINLPPEGSHIATTDINADQMSLFVYPFFGDVSATIEGLSEPTLGVAISNAAAGDNSVKVLLTL